MHRQRWRRLSGWRPQAVILFAVRYRIWLPQRRTICAHSPIPVVADIHFDYRLALASAEAGVSAIRINPGNIGAEERVKAVAEACRAKHIPIRIGVNSGSIEKHILEKYGSPTPEAMVESALYHVSLLNKYDFDDICISLKSSSVPNSGFTAR